MVLPLIIENVKELFKTYNIQSEEAITTTEVVVPLAYPFPNLGKRLAMLFVPFAAWFTGRPMGIADYGVYITAGFPNVSSTKFKPLKSMHSATYSLVTSEKSVSISKS